MAFFLVVFPPNPACIFPRHMSHVPAIKSKAKAIFCLLRQRARNLMLQVRRHHALYLPCIWKIHATLQFKIFLFFSFCHLKTKLKFFTFPGGKREKRIILDLKVTHISQMHGRYIAWCLLTRNIRWRAFWRNMACYMLRNSHWSVYFGHLQTL